MRVPQGYLVISSPDKTQEADTITCHHCQKIGIVYTNIDPASLGGFCRQCMKYICGPCADLGNCTPWEKTMEKMERRGLLLKQVERGW